MAGAEAEAEAAEADAKDGGTVEQGARQLLPEGMGVEWNQREGREGVQGQIGYRTR